ncbi:hypothetical protein [Enterococcus italicus]|uniref:hypothetical protein n=1 Tax=Enterococcus italicus TaxID=246144 RepID=UPI002073C473|nr:hypothetical protein [Enterococcus italicus]
MLINKRKENLYKSFKNLEIKNKNRKLEFKNNMLNSERSFLEKNERVEQKLNKFMNDQKK